MQSALCLLMWYINAFQIQFKFKIVIDRSILTLAYWIYFKKHGNIFAFSTQVAKYIPHRRQGPIYPAWSIPWLLVSWRCKEPRHQQQLYWPSSPRIFPSQHYKGTYFFKTILMPIFRIQNNHLCDLLLPSCYINLTHCSLVMPIWWYTSGSTLARVMALLLDGKKPLPEINVDLSSVKSHCFHLRPKDTNQ